MGGMYLLTVQVLRATCYATSLPERNVKGQRKKAANLPSGGRVLPSRSFVPGETQSLPGRIVWKGPTISPEFPDP